jgi:hypothetical protein
MQYSVREGEASQRNQEMYAIVQIKIKRVLQLAKDQRW